MSVAFPVFPLAYLGSITVAYFLINIPIHCYVPSSCYYLSIHQDLFSFIINLYLEAYSNSFISGSLFTSLEAIFVK